jgi:hypothetical protein
MPESLTLSGLSFRVESMFRMWICVRGKNVDDRKWFPALAYWLPGRAGELFLRRPVKNRGIQALVGNLRPDIAKMRTAELQHPE